MILLYTTFPTLDVAKKICNELVTSQMVKCANIMNPGVSIYLWEEKLKNEEEVYAYLKAPKENLQQIESFFHSRHPYENFCLLEVELGYVIKAYADWIQKK